jgi:signal transduction histidine kinase
VTNSSRRALGTDIAVSIAAGLSYFAMCWLGLSLDVTAGVSSVWPASGLLTGLLLVSPRDRWRAIGAGALIGGVAANLAIGFNPIASVGYTLINLGESLFATLLIRRIAPSAIGLRQPADIIAFTALCLAAATGASILAAALAATVSGAAFWTALRTWLAADVSGIITIAPVVLAIARGGDGGVQWTRRRVAECALMLALFATGSWWIFFAPHTSVQTPFTQPFSLMPFAVWAAFRFGVSGIIWLLLVLNGFSFWGTSLGRGPFASDHVLVAHLTVQVFSCTASMLCLVVSTAVESARRSARLHRELALQVQSAGEAERTRLAHELHDDIAQKLAALKMQLELDRLAPRQDGAVDSVGAVDQLIADVRALSRSLRPAPFEEGQLIPALATLARTEGRRAGLCVLVDAPAEDVSLSREAELACYRVVREAVSNIIKHAQANHLAVSALAQADYFSIRIVDDGTGFDVAPAVRKAVLDGHLGLMGMQERLQEVGGTLKIRSRRGGGTMVECRVPLIASV